MGYIREQFEEVKSELYAKYKKNHDKKEVTNMEIEKAISRNRVIILQISDEKEYLNKFSEFDWEAMGKLPKEVDSTLQQAFTAFRKLEKELNEGVEIIHKLEKIKEKHINDTNIAKKFKNDYVDAVTALLSRYGESTLLSFDAPTMNRRKKLFFTEELYVYADKTLFEQIVVQK